MPVLTNSLRAPYRETTRRRYRYSWAIDRASLAALAWLRLMPWLKIIEAERGCGAWAGCLSWRLYRPELRAEVDAIREAAGKPVHWRRRKKLDTLEPSGQIAGHA